LPKSQDEEAKKLGFRKERSQDGTQTHLVLTVDATLDDEHLERVADLVAELG
jgi:hypothetical protein